MTAKTFTARAIRYVATSEIPSMLSEDERALYYDTARTYANKGRVIELGTWLGSGTYEICRGLAKTGPVWHLTVFDRFTWTDFYHRHYSQPGLEVGDSFLPRFLGNLTDYRDKITVVADDLGHIEEALPLNSEVEILFVDAPKSWRMLWHVLHHIGPHLMNGSRIVLQDFFHIVSRQLVWLTMMIPQLKMESFVKVGTSALFIADGPITDLAGHAPRDFAQLQSADFRRLWQRIQQEFPVNRAAESAVGLALDLLALNLGDEASELLQEGVIDTGQMEPIAKEVRRLLRKAGKEADHLRAIGLYLEQGHSLLGVPSPLQAPAKAVGGASAADEDEGQPPPDDDAPDAESRGPRSDDAAR